MNSQTKDQPLASTIDALRLAATVQALAILLVAVVLLAGPGRRIAGTAPQGPVRPASTRRTRCAGDRRAAIGA